MPDRTPIPRVDRVKPASNSLLPRSSLGGYLGSILVVLACTLANWPLSVFLSPTNMIMVYLLGVVAIAARFGRGPSIVASVLSVTAFDFFFVPPILNLAVDDTQYLLTFSVMLATALVISTLTARVKRQAEAARAREQRTASLYGISHQLSAAQTREQVAGAAARHVADAVDARVALLFLDGQGCLSSLGNDSTNFALSPSEEQVVRWVVDHGTIAGHGTATLPAATGVYFPLRASRGTAGVLAVIPREPWRAIGSERLQLLDAFAGLIALALERVQLAGEAASVRIEVETERLRSSLLSAVSHDLRTPLSVITGGASTLLDSGQSLDEGTRRDLLQSVLDEADRLNRLVANLLDMTRLEAGALVVRKQWQAIEEIVGSALARTSRQLKDHAVVTHLEGDLPFVPIDDLLIEQVLVNLLENAAKYSPLASTIELTAVLDDSHLVVTVADRGPGLPPSDLPRIFDKFYRATNAGGRPGAGLGLAICRGIVELHGGTIAAENRPGGGSLFRFCLPRTAPGLPLPAVPVEA